MVIMILERVTPGLRGELSRWLLEPKAGVFVGTVSALVRDRLWEHTCEKLRGGGGMLIYSAANEQGFAVKYAGETRRMTREYEGLTLICTPEARATS